MASGHVWSHLVSVKEEVCADLHLQDLDDDPLDLDADVDLDAALGAHTAHGFLAEANSLACLDTWDDDVLLSNAGLPETNPLLELDSFVLGDWDFNTQSEIDDLPDVIPLEEPRGSDSFSEDFFDVEENSEETTGTTEEFSSDSTPASSCTSPTSSPTTAPPSLSWPPASAVPQSPSKFSMTKKSLAGIVISSGPGGHFETYEVLEAEEGEDHADNGEPNSYPKSIEDLCQSSQIVQAVQNHFSGSNRCFASGRVPKIVSSQRIKDSLPKEIIEKIIASSQKSKTIAIIEPVQKTLSASSSSCKGGSASRFNDAAVSLSKNRLRNLGLTQAVAAIAKSSAPCGGRSVQVSLDHDYCASNKSRRGRGLASEHQHRALLQVPSAVRVMPSAIATPKTAITSTQSAASRRPLSPSASSLFRVSNPSCVGKAKELLQVIRVEKPESMLALRLQLQQKSVALCQTKRAETAAAGNNCSQTSPFDGKKDSGLESGEASDEASSSNNEDDLKRIAVAGEKSSSKVATTVRRDRLLCEIVTAPAATLRCDTASDVRSKRKARISARKRTSSASSSVSCTSSSSLESAAAVESPAAAQDSPHRCPRRRSNTFRLGRSSSSSLSRSRSPVTPASRRREGRQQRIVYVGKIAEGTTRAELRKRFEVFGAVQEISLHFRDHGGNYGFVTFCDKASAQKAIIHGNDDRTLQKVELCFGNERNLCNEKYSSLVASSSRKTRSSTLSKSTNSRRRVKP